MADHRPRFVTFVNPVLEKGACAFVRIAHELGRRRPDIPLLVVESRGTRENLAALGLGRDDFVNVQMMPNTIDPRRFYALTRIALLPSLCPENQPLVAVESMINGIPVIGSDRGGIPEVLGDCGFVLPLPDRLTPTGRIVPEADEVEPWVETIVRLWDDRALYQEQSLKARAEAMALASGSGPADVCRVLSGCPVSGRGVGLRLRPGKWGQAPGLRGCGGKRGGCGAAGSQSPFSSGGTGGPRLRPGKWGQAPGLRGCGGKRGGSGAAGSQSPFSSGRSSSFGLWRLGSG